MSHPSETQDRCESPPAPTLCSNNCGFFANPECNGMCSICFKHFLSRQTAPSTEAEEVVPAQQFSPPIPVHPVPTTSSTEPVPQSNTDAAVASPAKRARPTRCSKCSKRVGLMAFSCRCGGQFCQVHRYPEEHDCPFDRKAAERMKLKDENPVVLRDKIERL